MTHTLISSPSDPVLKTMRSTFDHFQNLWILSNIHLLLRGSPHRPSDRALSWVSSRSQPWSHAPSLFSTSPWLDPAAGKNRKWVRNETRFDEVVLSSTWRGRDRTLDYYRRISRTLIFFFLVSYRIVNLLCYWKWVNSLPPTLWTEMGLSSSAQVRALKPARAQTVHRSPEPTTLPWRVSQCVIRIFKFLVLPFIPSKRISWMGSIKMFHAVLSIRIRCKIS